MKIYKVSCYSRNGTYFAQYLQAVYVIATDAERAAELAHGWRQRNGESFISDNIRTEELGPVIEGVFETVFDSDY